MRALVPAALLLLLCCAASVARAGVADGQLDAFYGAPLSVQTTQTSLGDQPGNFLYGAELDQAFAAVVDDTLWVLIAGSFNRFISEPLTFPYPVQLFLDTGPGGQNVLSAANPSVGGFLPLPLMAGLRFDPEFSPDHWFSAAREFGGGTFATAYWAALPAGGGGASATLGSTELGGDGALTGGTDSRGVRMNVDPSNAAGVTLGCDAGSGSGVTTGFEFAIPLASIGSPTGTLKLCALLASQVAGPGASVSNQILGPVPAGTCALGAPSGVDFGSVSGPQYFTLEIPVPVKRESWGRLKSRFR